MKPRALHSPSGQRVGANDLYSVTDEGDLDEEDKETLLGLLRVFQADPHGYEGSDHPPSVAITVADMVRAHPTNRWDPKFHVFRKLEEADPPAGFTRARLGDRLRRRRETIDPSTEPDRLFKTIKLGQDGSLSPREAGKGKPRR